MPSNLTVNNMQEFNIFTIDNGQPLPTEVHMNSNSSNDLHTFIQNIYESFTKLKTRRSCIFSSLQDLFVAENLKEIIKMKLELSLDPNEESQDNIASNKVIFQGVLKNRSQNIAEKLLNVQKNYISNNTNASKNPSNGSLIIIFTESDEDPNKFNFLISKINLEVYLDKEESQFRAGLPEKNSVQKSFFTEIIYNSESNEIEFNNTQIADSNHKISDFWMNSFLQVDFSNDDTNNTLTAFKSIRSVINRKLRSSPNDKIRLENNLIGYFENTESFNNENAVKAIVGDKALKGTIGITNEELKETLLKLPEEKKYDTSFEIKEPVIETEFKKTIPISDTIDLRTKSHIENLETKIITRTDDEGAYELVIKNIDQKTYESFKQDD